MIRSLIKILIGFCLCFDLSAKCIIDSKMISNDEGHVSWINISIKNTDPQEVGVRANVSVGIKEKDGVFVWLLLSKNNIAGYKCDVAGGTGDTINVDIIKTLKAREIMSSSVQKLKIEVTGSDQSKERVIETYSRVYDLNSDK